MPWVLRRQLRVLPQRVRHWLVRVRLRPAWLRVGALLRRVANGACCAAASDAKRHERTVYSSVGAARDAPLCSAVSSALYAAVLPTANGAGAIGTAVLPTATGA